MKIPLSDVESALKDAFADALKDRFAKIASNSLSIKEIEVETEIRNALINLKDVHERACRIATELFD